MSWYGRSLTGGTVIEGDTTVSYKDENGTNTYHNYSDLDHRDFYTMEMYRESESVIKFFIDRNLKYTLDGIVFGDDYRIFMATDNYATPTEIEIDYIEIITP